MNLGTLKNRLNKRYLAGVAAVLAVAAIACLWLLPSTYEQQLGEARRLLVEILAVGTKVPNGVPLPVVKRTI